LLSQNTMSMSDVFSAYFAERKPNADAIANMALDNFTEVILFFFSSLGFCY
jgi:HJR/Mrr/RecB family endonuclease